MIRYLTNVVLMDLMVPFTLQKVLLYVIAGCFQLQNIENNPMASKFRSLRFIIQHSLCSCNLH